eukprot:TRINITY_DN61498_c0_g1_i1.p1 TRINITY_DN61498_c0_g1~~TRINITY_DN61498_c0_g1_i1.p1  ORF type:complete len:570 (-),score=69.41 TRINITY_DN61498_c0_g1_i1:473-2116(-)
MAPEICLDGLLELHHIGDPEALGRLEAWAAFEAHRDGRDHCSIQNLVRLCDACRDAGAPAARRLTGALANLVTSRLLTDRSTEFGERSAFARVIAELCITLFNRLLGFLGAARQLLTTNLPRYALPVDLAVACAHCCAVLHRIEPIADIAVGGVVWPVLAEPQVAVALLEMARAPVVNFFDDCFMLAVEAVRDRSSWLCLRVTTLLGQMVGNSDALAPAGFPNLQDFWLADIDVDAKWPSCSTTYRRRRLRSKVRWPPSVAVEVGDDVELLASTDGSVCSRVLLVHRVKALIAAWEAGGAYLTCEVTALRASGEGGATKHSPPCVQSHFETLGLTDSAPHEEVARAYRRLVRRHHPDKGGEEAEFRRVQEAFEALSMSSSTRRRGAAEGFARPSGRAAPGAHSESGFGATSHRVRHQQHSSQVPAAEFRATTTEGLRHASLPTEGMGFEEGIGFASVSSSTKTIRRRMRSKTPPLTTSSPSSRTLQSTGRDLPKPSVKRACRRAPTEISRVGENLFGVVGNSGPACRSPARELTLNAVLQLIWTFAF